MPATLTGVSSIDARFLFRTPDGAFMRIEHATPAKAGLPSRATSITAAQ